MIWQLLQQQKNADNKNNTVTTRWKEKEIFHSKKVIAVKRWAFAWHVYSHM